MQSHHSHSCIAHPRVAASTGAQTQFPFRRTQQTRRGCVPRGESPFTWYGYLDNEIATLTTLRLVPDGPRSVVCAYGCGLSLAMGMLELIAETASTGDQLRGLHAPHCPVCVDVARPGQAPAPTRTRPATDLDDDCIVCLSAPVQVVIGACGHATLCHSCLQTLEDRADPEVGTACPCCRAPLWKGTRAESSCFVFGSYRERVVSLSSASLARDCQGCGGDPGAVPARVCASEHCPRRSVFCRACVDSEKDSSDSPRCLGCRGYRHLVKTFRA